MIKTIRTRVHQTKEFVQKHKTLAVCAATAAVTAYVVHDRDVTTLKEISAHLLLDEDERFAMLLDTTSFLDEKGLWKEFIEYAPRLKRD